jgi:hypothetical protein
MGSTTMNATLRFPQNTCMANSNGTQQTIAVSTHEQSMFRAVVVFVVAVAVAPPLPFPPSHHPPPPPNPEIHTRHSKSQHPMFETVTVGVAHPGASTPPPPSL